MNPYKEHTIILATKQKWCLHCIYVTWDIKNGTEAMNKCFKHKQDHNELHYRKSGACMCVLLQISVTPSLPPIDWFNHHIYWKKLCFVLHLGRTMENTNHMNVQHGNILFPIFMSYFFNSFNVPSFCNVWGQTCVSNSRKNTLVIPVNLKHRSSAVHWPVMSCVRDLHGINNVNTWKPFSKVHRYVWNIRRH